MAEKEIAIKVENLTKTFKIPLEAHSGLKQKLINTLKGRKGYREFTPLKNISFEIQKGEFFGIVGRNGSGKSTLLKSLAGIYTPNAGAVQVNGTLVPFIELGVGFNPELTGRENVFLNGALLGFSHKQMEEMYDDIVDFAELHDFMEERLKNYSSGMQVRLAFSIAIRAEGDILLLDEVLAVGDEAFQRKCYAYFDQLKELNKTVVLVTHDMASVLRFCDKALFINDGVIESIGDPEQAAKLYSKLNDEMYANARESEKTQVVESLISTRIINGRGDKFKQFYEDETLTLEVTWPLELNAKNIGIALVDSRGRDIYGTNTYREGYDIKGSKITYSVELNLQPGEYKFNIALFGEHDKKVVDRKYSTAKFIVEKDGDDAHLKYVGVTKLEHKWGGYDE